MQNFGACNEHVTRVPNKEGYLNKPSLVLNLSTSMESRVISTVNRMYHGLSARGEYCGKLIKIEKGEGGQKTYFYM